MGAIYYIVDKKPIFLTLKSYGKVMNACEERGTITEQDSIDYEFAFSCKQTHKKVYMAICQYLKSIKECDTDSFNREFLNCSCYNDEARDNLYRLLFSFCDYYGDYCFKSFSGRDDDLRFLMGRRYWFSHISKNERSSVDIFINTDTVASFHGNIERFVAFFVTGMVISANRGIISVYFDKKGGD